MDQQWPNERFQQNPEPKNCIFIRVAIFSKENPGPASSAITAHWTFETEKRMYLSTKA